MLADTALSVTVTEDAGVASGCRFPGECVHGGITDVTAGGEGYGDYGATRRMGRGATTTNGERRGRWGDGERHLAQHSY